MSYKLKIIRGFVRKPKRTNWHIAFVPTVFICRSDIISGQPFFAVSIVWLMCTIGIDLVFEKKK